MPKLPRSPARRLRLAARAVLVLGWLAAVVVYALVPSVAVDTQAAAVEAAMQDQEMYQVERLGGKAAVYTLEFQRWVGSLWHGERLAFTLAVLATLIAWLCFYIADLIAAGEDE